MKQEIFKILTNQQLAKDVYRMTLTGDTCGIRPGQFVNIKLDGLYLRRPISVCDCVGCVLTLIYKVVGKGTELMSKMTQCEELDVLTGLGNGYDLTKSGETPLLIGGGVGVPPLYMLCRKYTTIRSNAITGQSCSEQLPFCQLKSVAATLSF